MRTAPLVLAAFILVGSSPALAQDWVDYVSREDFFRYWQSDKKHNPNAYRPILLDEQGFLYRAELTRDAAADNAIWGGFEAARRKVAEQARIGA